MVLGEPRILGQIKVAYQVANSATRRPAGRLLYTFSVAKQVRTDTRIGASPVSVAFAAVGLARQIFADLPRCAALLIGAGDTVVVARHLHESGVRAADRGNHTAGTPMLAASFAGYAIALDEISAHLGEADIVIASTASPDPLLGATLVRQCLKQRRHRPMFMVDLAVPRDIDPAVAELDDVYLYSGRPQGHHSG
ncbi:MAG: hypothetical protein R3F44_14725 [Candidatus Competibacteraceae bacterium]